MKTFMALAAGDMAGWNSMFHPSAHHFTPLLRQPPSRSSSSRHQMIPCAAAGVQREEIEEDIPQRVQPREREFAGITGGEMRDGGGVMSCAVNGGWACGWTPRGSRPILQERQQTARGSEETRALEHRDEKLRRNHQRWWIEDAACNGPWSILCKQRIYSRKILAELNLPRSLTIGVQRSTPRGSMRKRREACVSSGLNSVANSER
jgi:hypothetical protein